MTSYEERVATFTSWPHILPKSSDLAATGFQYVPTTSCQKVGYEGTTVIKVMCKMDGFYLRSLLGDVFDPILLEWYSRQAHRS